MIIDMTQRIETITRPPPLLGAPPRKADEVSIPKSERNCWEELQRAQRERGTAGRSCRAGGTAGKSCCEPRRSRQGSDRATCNRSHRSDNASHGSDTFAGWHRNSSRERNAPLRRWMRVTVRRHQPRGAKKSSLECWQVVLGPPLRWEAVHSERVARSTRRSSQPPASQKDLGVPFTEAWSWTRHSYFEIIVDCQRFLSPKASLSACWPRPSTRAGAAPWSVCRRCCARCTRSPRRPRRIPTTIWAGDGTSCSHSEEAPGSTEEER